MGEQFIEYKVDGNVALIGLNRPNKRNALNEALVGELASAVERAGKEVAAAVIYGVGPAFSAGLDLAELAARLQAPTEQSFRPGRSIWHSTFDLIARGPIPFIAALHGATIGGGLELAAAAHIRVADETTYFALPEGRRGIFVGGGGSVRIQRIIGYSTMADMMLTGRVVSAEEGRAIRLVQYVVEGGTVLSKAIEIAKRVGENTPQTNWQITNVLPRINDMSHDDGLFAEYLNSRMPRPPASLERLQEFLEKQATPLR